MIYNHIPVTIGCLPKVTAAPINFQYDQVQILQIGGIELPTSYRVDFCNPGDAATITMVGTADGVEIPNQLLATGRPVIAYVVLNGTDENAVETRYQITLPVNKRPPASDIQPTPAEQSTIDSLIEAMNDAVDAAEDAQAAAELAQDGAETAETGAEAQALKAEGYAVGTQDGTPVTSGSPYYENNAEYMKDAAAQYALAADASEGEAAAWATGSYSGDPSGIPVPDDAPQHNNNAHYYKEQAAASADAAEAALEQFTTPTASASTLPTGSSATASYNNGNFAFGIPKGDKGDPGTDGTDGTDGVSPEVTITSITGGHNVKITDADHPAGQSFNVMNGTDGTDGTDGVSPEVTITSITGGHTVKITDADHPTGQSFNVMDGEDGVSPEVTITSITGGHTVKITDADHPTGQSFNVMDGANTDADDVTYDPTETYTAGSVGAGLNQLNSEITDLTNNKAPVITDTASGAIASFPDGAKNLPIKSMTIQINPVQSGSGDPSPNNVRPISGWTRANVEQTGKNFCDESKLLQASGWTVADGVYSGLNSALFTAFRATKGFPGVTYFKPDTQYTVSFMFKTTTASKNTIVGFVYTDGTSSYEYCANLSWAKKTITSTSGKSIKWMYWEYGSNDTCYISELQVEEGTTATDYASFQGQTLPITFPDAAGTVWGAELTVLDDGTGKLSSRRVKKIFDGTETILFSRASATQGYAMFSLGAKGTYVSGSGISNMLKPVTSGINTADWSQHVQNSSAYNRDQIAFRFDNSFDGGNVQGCIANYTAELARLYAAGTPLEVCYELTEPVEYDLTAEEVGGILATLYGQNNIWSDTGDVSLEYRADTKLYLEKLTAPTEDDLIADHAIASGTFFMIGNQLFKATAAIANGAAITIGTNATQLSLADALNLINA